MSISQHLNSKKKYVHDKFVNFCVESSIFDTKSIKFI